MQSKKLYTKTGTITTTLLTALSAEWKYSCVKYTNPPYSQLIESQLSLFVYIS